MTKAHRLPKGTITTTTIAVNDAAKPKENPPMRARPREHLTSLPSSEFSIGPFKVRMSNKQHYRLYSIYTPDGACIGKQASYPSIFDCMDKLEKAASVGTVAYSLYQNLLTNRDVSRLIKERNTHDAA